MPIVSAITFNLSLIFNVVRTIIDLILVWYVIYVLISMMRQNMRTMQLFKGVLLILNAQIRLDNVHEFTRFKCDGLFS